MFAYRSRIPELPLRALIPLLLLGMAAFFRAPGGAADADRRGQDMIFRDFAQTIGALSGGTLSAWMPLLSWLSAGLALWLFDLNLRLVSPGARAQSRSFYSVIFFCLAPIFFRSGWSLNPDMPVLALLLGFVWLTGKAMENLHFRHVAGAAAGGLVLMVVQPILWPAALCMVIGLGWTLGRAGRPGVLSAFLALVVAAGGGFIWFLGSGTSDWAAAAQWSDWTPANWFARHTAEGAAGVRPNALFVLFLLFHPAFCILMPALLLLWKRTDWRRPLRQWLLTALAAYLLFLSGLPGQKLRDLLPAYGLLLLLLFQSWDRFQSYGEFFLPRLTYGILAAAISAQLLANMFL
jgi:hypothetical protein